MLPLSGVCVLDLTRVLAGPFCTQLLGDYGATIIKIEKPGSGDDTRSWGPPFLTSKTNSSSSSSGTPSDNNWFQQSAYFIAANRHKKSVAIDFTKPEGQALIHRLALKSQVFMENFVPGALAKYKLDYESVQSRNPGIIYVSLTGYGSDGPFAKHAGYDVVIEGEAGLMHITGEKDRPPSKVGVAITDITTGLYAHGAILAALLQKSKSNLGQKIDVSLLNCQVASLANISSNYLIAGKEASRLGTAHSSIVPYQAFQLAKEGEYFIIGAGNDNQFQKLCKVLQLENLSSDPRFRSNKDRVENREPLLEILNRKFKSMSRDACISLFKDSGIPHGPVNNIGQTFRHPQLLHNDIVKRVTHPLIGDFDIVGNPLRFSGFEPDYSNCAPPLLGEHTTEILQNMLEMDEKAIRNLEDSCVIQCQKK